jgi:chromosome partitioning protein
MEPSIPTQVLQSPDDLKDQLTDLAATVDYLVVDGPAGLSEATTAILMRADESGGSSATERYRRTISRRCGETRLIKQAMEVRQSPPQAVMFRLPCGEGDKAQNRSNGVVQINLHPPSSRTQICHSPQTSDRLYFFWQRDF